MSLKNRRGVVFSAVFLILGLSSGAWAMPRMVVVVSVDQMRADYLDRFAGKYRSGLKRLREEGAVFSQAYHAHTPSETGPGHAVIMTGQFPERTGIVGNEWRDSSGSMTYVVADSLHAIGPEHLLSYTVGDALKAKDGRALVVCLSLKDRAAVLMGGKKADLALWFDKGGKEFTTSSYYALPSWLEAFNRKFAPEISGDFLDTPASDRLLLDLTEEALKRLPLGKDSIPDILAVSFSGTDYVGHRYGPDSPQIENQMLSLDALLGELLDRLKAKVGAGRFDLVLTSDHGVAPVPESPEGKALQGRRVLWKNLEAALELALEWNIPAGKDSSRRWVLGFSYPNLYLNLDLAKKLGLEPSAFLRRAARALRSVDGMAAVYIPGELDPSDPYAEIYRRSFMPGRSGDLMLRVAPGVVLTDRTAGSDHGTPYDYDAHVPLIFWGPDFKSGRFEERALVADLAPTVAELLEVKFPTAQGQSRAESFREEAR
ncbi:MAG: alkaline phosphatase family protein [Elusimicrobia bacterium]|nr:alkaline phosphatase family protein [Elusimicrobiota bacterium]